MEENYYNYNNLQHYLTKKGITQQDEYLRWFKEICDTKISMFSYKNLPEGLTSQIMEMALFYNNFLCFYDSPELGLVLCRYIFGGEYDIYWKPITVNLLSLSGKPIAYGVPYKDIVLVRDNLTDIPPFLTLNSWINKILEQERTLEILTLLVRFPTILTGDKEQATMLKQLIHKAYNFEGLIIANKGYKEHLEQFDIKLPCKPYEMYELMDKYKKLALGSMGIYSADEKRERIVSAEIAAQNDQVDFIYTEMVEERKNFIKLCNEKFGTNIELVENYITNREDEITLTTELNKEVALAQAQAQIKVEEVKNDGKIEVAEIESEALENGNIIHN